MGASTASMAAAKFYYNNCESAKDNLNVSFALPKQAALQTINYLRLGDHALEQTHGAKTFRILVVCPLDPYVERVKPRTHPV